jgi:DtxR family Mn-dependent transcriptional regulator
VSDAALALIAFFGGLTLVAAILWPGKGLLARWRAMRSLSERERIEDSLKHLHDSEYRGHPGSLDSLAGALGLPRSETVELLETIEARGLVERDGTELHLTRQGRDYALHVIRLHRLWERHLADETGMPEIDWHGDADRREHVMTAEEADRLAAELGDPRYDPHGDPIPTAQGQLPEQQGKPLTSLPVGGFGAIVHVEDEPREVYAQLVAEGLHPGMRVQVLGISPERVSFWSAGNEHVLAPVVAANLWCIPLPREKAERGPFDTLATLRPGEGGRVLQLAPSCRGLQRRRLMDLGLVPGTEVTAELSSIAGDPTAYRVRGTLIALREDQAKLVQITRDAGAAT